VPGLEFQLESHAGKIKALSLVWFLYAALFTYAALCQVTGFTGLAFVMKYLLPDFGPWAHGSWTGGGPLPHMWLAPAPALIRLVWAFVMLRVGLALIAGLGLLKRAQWGRIVAIVAALLSLLQFPSGTAIGIWTLVVLMGYRNARLYDQLHLPPTYPVPRCLEPILIELSLSSPTPPRPRKQRRGFTVHC
jgi:hypothetical protein